MGNIFYKKNDLEEKCEFFNKNLYLEIKEEICKSKKIVDNIEDKNKIFNESIIININGSFPFIYYMKITEYIKHNVIGIALIIQFINNKEKVLLTFHKGSGSIFYKNLILKLDDDNKNIKVDIYDSEKNIEINHDNILNDNNLVKNLFDLFNDFLKKIKLN